MIVCKNKKNGKMYEVLFTALDVTKNKDEECVVYKLVDSADKTYVRSREEFDEKFDYIIDSSMVVRSLKNMKGSEDDT